METPSSAEHLRIEKAATLTFKATLTKVALTLTKATLTFKDRCFGGSSLWCRSYKSGCRMWDSNPPLLREKLGIVSSLLIVACCPSGGIYGETVSQPLLSALMWDFFSFTWCAKVDQQVLKFFCRGNCSIWSCWFGVSVGEDGFRLLLCHHLEPFCVNFEKGHRETETISN